MQHIYTPFQRSLWDCHSLFQKNHDAWKVTNSLDCLRNTRIIINLDDKWLWAYQFSFLPQALPKSWVKFTDHVENPCSGSQSGLCVRLSPDFKIYRYKYIHVPGSIQEPLNQSVEMKSGIYIRFFSNHLQVILMQARIQTATSTFHFLYFLSSNDFHHRSISVTYF